LSEKLIQGKTYDSGSINNKWLLEQKALEQERRGMIRTYQYLGECPFAADQGVCKGEEEKGGVRTANFSRNRKSRGTVLELEMAELMKEGGDLGGGL